MGLREELPEWHTGIKKWYCGQEDMKIRQYEYVDGELRPVTYVVHSIKELKDLIETLKKKYVEKNAVRDSLTHSGYIEYSKSLDELFTKQALRP